MFGFFDWVREYLDFLLGWIPEMLGDFAVLLMAKLTVLFAKLQLAALSFAWDVGEQILVDLQIANKIAAGWDLLDAGTQQMLFVLNIPECLTYMSTCFATKFVLRFIPFA